MDDETRSRMLQRIAERPAPFSRSTVRELWTEPHLAQQMLRYHLDGTVDAASRRTAFIEASVDWIVDTFGVGPGQRVVDLGCGPGLYTNRLAATGADVTGIDFSATSLAHARSVAAERGLDVTYVEADYLEWQAAGRYDLVTMIYCDLCALAPSQRTRLLARIREALAPGGAFLFDVVTPAFLAAKAKDQVIRDAPDLMDGYWSPLPYHGFHATMAYAVERVTLDRYLIVDEAGTREYLNWLQCFTPASLADELAAAGFRVDALLGDVAGRPYDPDDLEMAVIART